MLFAVRARTNTFYVKSNSVTVLCNFDVSGRMHATWLRSTGKSSKRYSDFAYHRSVCEFLLTNSSW